MKQTIIVFIIGTMLLTACSAPQSEQLQLLIEQTITSMPTQIPYPTYTPNPTYTPYPTYTLVPTASKTPQPTQTPTQLPNEDPTGIAVAKNHVQTWEAKGVTVELLRVLICDKSFSDVSTFSNIPAWKNAKSYIMFEFKASNNSEKRANLMLFQGSMVATGGKQVEGSDFLWDLDYFGDDPSGDLMPGVSMQGGFWLPLDISFDEIQVVYLDFVGAFVDSTGIFRNMELQLDISDWTFEPRLEDS